MADSRISGSRKVSARAGDSTRVSMTKKRKKRRAAKAAKAKAIEQPAAAPTAPVDDTKVP